MEVEEALINDRLYVSKESSKFCISAIYNFATVYMLNFLFSWKVFYFWIVCIVFSVYKQNFTAQ